MDAAAAKRAARDFGAPVVIKASGLAAGKGVIVCETMADADARSTRCSRDDSFGAAGREVLVEEFMEGEELSLFAITDGDDGAADARRRRTTSGCSTATGGPIRAGWAPMPPCRSSSAALVEDAVERVFVPTLAALRAAGRHSAASYMPGSCSRPRARRWWSSTAASAIRRPRRFCHFMDSSLLEPMLAVARGSRLARDVAWSGRASSSNHRSCGSGISGSTASRDAPSSCPAPARHPRLSRRHRHRTRRVTDRRRRTGACGDRRRRHPRGRPARKRALARKSIALEGKQLRTDIGWREQERSARASRD